MGFDFEAGWSTSRANLHQDEDWVGTLAQIAIVAAVAWASAGTLGPAVAGSMGMSTAALAKQSSRPRWEAGAGAEASTGTATG